MFRSMLILLLLLAPGGTEANSWRWMSTEQYLEESTLIAILQVGEIHEVATPEGIAVESAPATIEKIIYYKHAAHDKLPETIGVFYVNPNDKIDGEKVFAAGGLRLQSGRVLAVLKEGGWHKFTLYDRFSLRVIKEGEKLYWPSKTTPTTEELTLGQIVERIEKAMQSGKKKPPLKK